MDKQRELFEVWAESQGLSLELFPYDVDTYNWDKTDSAWEAWQAAIASVVVELPDYLAVDSVAYYAKLTEDAIKKAGIKWTE